MIRPLPAFLILGLLLPGPSAAAGSGPLHKLTILFTNDVHGYVEPCG